MDAYTVLHKRQKAKKAKLTPAEKRAQEKEAAKKAAAKAAQDKAAAKAAQEKAAAKAAQEKAAEDAAAKAAIEEQQRADEKAQAAEEAPVVQAPKNRTVPNAKQPAPKDTASLVPPITPVNTTTNQSSEIIPVVNTTVAPNTSNELPISNFEPNQDIDSNASSSSLDNSNTDMNTTKLVAIVLPVLAVAALLIVGLLFYRRKHRARDGAAGKAASRLDLAIHSISPGQWFGGNDKQLDIVPINAPHYYGNEPPMPGISQRNYEMPAPAPASEAAPNEYGFKAMLDTSVTTVTAIGRGLVGMVTGAKPEEESTTPNESNEIIMTHAVSNEATIASGPNKFYPPTRNSSYSAYKIMQGRHIPGEEIHSQSLGNQRFETFNASPEPAPQETYEQSLKMEEQESTFDVDPIVDDITPLNNYRQFQSMVSITDLDAEFVPPSAGIEETNIFANQVRHTDSVRISHNLNRNSLYSPEEIEPAPAGPLQAFKNAHYSIYSDFGAFDPK